MSEGRLQRDRQTFSSSDRAREQWAQTKAQEIPCQHQETFFTLGMTVHGHSLPREMVEFSTLETVKSHPDMVLGGPV